MRPPVLPADWQVGRCRVVAPAHPTAALSVLLMLRDADLLELYATCPDDEPDYLAAAERIARSHVSCVFMADDMPAAVMFLNQTWGGVWQGGMLGTPDFPRIAVQATRYCVSVWGGAFVANALGHRIQMLAHAGNEASIDWMVRCLGGRIEGELRSFGRNREPFVMVGWEIEDVQLRSCGSGRHAAGWSGDGVHRAPQAQDAQLLHAGAGGAGVQLRAAGPCRASQLGRAGRG